MQGLGKGILIGAGAAARMSSAASGRDCVNGPGAAEPQPNQPSLRFLCVLCVFAVKVLSRIHRQDAKSAKKSAKKNSFQAAKDFRVSSMEVERGPGFAPTALGRKIKPSWRQETRVPALILRVSVRA